MTPLELAEMVLAGRFIIAGEVRGATAKPSGYVDKKTGLSLTTILCTYFVERNCSRGFEFVKISKRAPQGVTDPTQVSLGVVKGKTYAFEVENIERKPGSLVAWMGAMEPQEVEIGTAATASPQGEAVAAALNLVKIETSPTDP